MLKILDSSLVAFTCYCLIVIQFSISLKLYYLIPLFLNSYAVYFLMLIFKVFSSLSYWIFVKLLLYSPVFKFRIKLPLQTFVIIFNISSASFPETVG